MSLQSRISVLLAAPVKFSKTIMKSLQVCNSLGIVCSLIGESHKILCRVIDSLCVSFLVSNLTLFLGLGFNS